MKTLLLLLALLLPACIPSIIDRNTLAENLTPILRLEEKVAVIEFRVNFLGQLGLLSDEFFAEMKSHRDIYYPYYVVANVYLGNGQLEQYKEAVRKAEKELIAMNNLLNALVDVSEPNERQSLSF